MSPERRLDATVIENDAQHITNFLLGIEAKAEAARQDLLDYELKDIRQKLDYTPVDTASSNNLVDTRILEKTPVITPYSLEKVIPVSPVSEETTQKSRFNIEQIITDEDDRLLVIIGPCSIHDPETALEFAEWALEMREKFGETLEIVMRAYFEKPRTELGWKGFINDSELDDSCDMNLGIVKSRMLACQITNAGVPIATERLNALTPQFFNGLIAYDTIGARNTSDQKAREYASGTSSPVGFKNTTEGSIKTATEAVVASRAPHTFLGMNEHGRIAQVRTGKEKDGEIIGNEYGHIILRGDNNGPNYSVDHIEEAKRWIKDKSIPEAIIVDASHGNSMRIENGAKKKDHTKQIEVIQEISRQVSLGETAIKGVMIEANLKAGKQDFEVGVTDPASLEKGKSITDACVDLEESEKMLGLLHGAVIIRRQIILSTSV